MNKIFALLAVLALSTVSYAQQDVKIKLMHQYNGQPFVQGQEYVDGQGRTVRIDRAEFYISQFSLEHDGGQVTTLPDLYVLGRPTQIEYPMDNLNITTLEAINYTLGVDSINNFGDPALWPATHPLALQNPSMHWGWAFGYKFLVLDGMIDSDGDNVPDEPFSMHVIGSEFERDVTLQTAGESNGSVLDIHIIVDYYNWISTMDLTAVGIQHGGGPTNGEVADNTLDNTVFSIPLNVDIEETQAPINNVFTDYTFPASPTLNYVLDANQSTNLIITDMTGKIVRSENNLAPNGKYLIGEGLSAGIYVCSFYSEGRLLISEKIQIAF